MKIMKRKTTNSKPPKYLAKILLILILATMGLIAYFLFVEKNPELAQNEQKKQTSQIEQKKYYFEEPLEKELESITETNQTHATIKEKETQKPQEQIKNEPKITIQDEPKPKKDAALVIIIDDVTTKEQVEKIKSLEYIVNLSFLPPTNIHPQSAKIAQNLNTQMIHLPMQATNFANEEEETLKIEDNYETIEKKIASLKNLYPTAKFINNHTGSKFSENEEACDNLMKALAKYNFAFVDSKTSSKSVLCKSAKKYGVKCLERNIFLDNEQDETYIQTQLQKAIKLAQKNGFAIAIGHPHKETFEVLAKSKNDLNSLKTVYIDKL